MLLRFWIASEISIAAFFPVLKSISWAFLKVAGDGPAIPIMGIPANDPVDLGGPKIGSKVEIARDEIEDWTVVRKGGIAGALSYKLFEELC